MKIRIWPKIIYCDSKELEQGFKPRTPGAKLLDQIREAVKLKEGYLNKLNQILKDNGLLYDRNQWCEIDFLAFREWFLKNYGDKEVVIKENNIEASIIEEELYRYDILDYQIYNEELKKWQSR